MKAVQGKGEDHHFAFLLITGRLEIWIQSLRLDVNHGIYNYLIVIALPLVLKVILLVAVLFMKVDADTITPIDITIGQLDDSANVQEGEYPLRSEEDPLQVGSLEVMQLLQLMKLF